MYAKDKLNPMVGLGMTTAMAMVMLTGCAGNPVARAEVSATGAQLAAETGEQVVAIQQAEAAVAADPRNSANRMALADAYLDAGRFGSAATTFDDAMELGENSPRAALSLLNPDMDYRPLLPRGDVKEGDEWEVGGNDITIYKAALAPR